MFKLMIATAAGVVGYLAGVWSEREHQRDQDRCRLAGGRPRPIDTQTALLHQSLINERIDELNRQWRRERAN